MNFEFSREQMELYAATVAFATRSLSAKRAEGGDEEAWFRARMRRTGGQGVLSAPIPEADGGLGMDALRSAHLVQALGYGADDFGFVFSVAAQLYACIVPIVRFGSAAQKARYLPALGAGEMVASHAITEPEAGSDPFSMKTTARLEGDRYVLNGAKCYASNAPYADLLVIHAKTEEKAGFLSVSAFLVERDTPGVAISPPHAKVALPGAPLGDIFLEDVRIPVSSRLGQEGNGGVIFSHSMNWERSCLFAAFLGAMERQLERCVAYAGERRQGGKRIGDYQAIAHRVADMKVRLEAARWLVYKAAWQLDQPGTEVVASASAIAKLFLSEAAVASALDTIQIHGGAGLMRETHVDHYLFDAVASRVFSGTSEIQRNTIARSLGLKSGH